MDATQRRWLITGATGRLGQVLVSALADEIAAGAIVITTTRSGTGISEKLELADLDTLAPLLDKIRPTHIVHLAGISSPAEVARAPEASRVVNVEATERIADWARRHHAWMLFTSTDMVFDGVGAPYGEYAPISPTTLYGQHKAECERSVLAARGTVARMGWMIGSADPAKDFLASAMQKLRNGTPVPAVNDEWRTPISFSAAAQALITLGKLRHEGLLHIGGDKATTAFDMLIEHASTAGLDPTLVRPVSRTTLAPSGRPSDIRLDSSKLQSLMATQTTHAPRLTIIVPVHNGAHFLPATIRALSPQVRPDMRIVIVANGCRDNSATVARRELAFHLPGYDTHVLELEQGSRTAALNAGDAIASGTRVMLDQDAVLSPRTLDALDGAIRHGAHFATAKLVWGARATLPVRLALSAWSEMPYVKKSPVSAGLYAFSSEARERFDQFSTRLPDDKWVRLLCSPAERIRLEDVTYTVSPPNTFGELVAARRRYAKSNHQLAEFCPELLQRDGKKWEGLLSFARRPGLWPGISVLTVAEVMARSQAL